MIIGIAGFKSAGKGTVADFLVDNGYTKISMADKLKDACAQIFGWDREMLEGITDESRAWREEVDEWWSELLDDHEFSPRKALQLMGTQAGREVFGPDIWVGATERVILENPTNYVIPDLRFPNEVAMVHRLRGITIRVKRGEDPDWYAPALTWNQTVKACKEKGMTNHTYLPSILKEIHESERDWIGEKFDHVIENNGTLEELEAKLDLIITE